VSTLFAAIPWPLLYSESHIGKSWAAREKPALDTNTLSAEDFLLHRLGPAWADHRGHVRSEAGPPRQPKPLQYGSGDDGANHSSDRGEAQAPPPLPPTRGHVPPARGFN
jgi:hypothetical protein